MDLFDRAYRDCKKTKKEYNEFVFDYDKKNVHNISQIWGLITVLAIFCLGCLTRYNLRENLPKALGVNDLLRQQNSFIAERAMKDLQVFTSFGPHPTGTYGNEVLAVDFLKREISFIQQLAHRNQKIEMDLQVVSGAYWAAFKPHGMTNVYRNVQNIVVKLHGESEGKGNHSLMLNCHFDSVAGSPGSSDDAASCCVMLETLRVLSKQSEVNKHSIIFLFNGAEETPLQASHGFITQHRWAKGIRAFINLESVGSGGKEILFQGGPNHPWLFKMYGKAVQHPSAQAAAEEVFQSGLIPSDTDFRIFRDFGGVVGLDFAHVINGYRYHTKFDHIDYLSKPVLQHTGDNILALTKLMANADELEDPQRHAEGTEVYYDVLGFFFVSYSKETGKMLNYVIAILSVTVPYIFLSRATKGINRKYVRYDIFFGFLINVICFVGGNAICYTIAYDLDASGRSMSWYSNTILAVTMFCVCSICFQCIVHLTLNSDKNTPLSLALRVQARLNGTSFFWALLTASITMAEYRIGYVTMVPLLINLLTNIVIGVCGLQNTILKWLYVHLVGQVFVIFWTTHFYHLVVDMFIPIAGRSGADKNPDAMISIICCSITFFVTSYISPLVILLRRTRHFLITLLVVFIISRYFIVVFTNHGFPYRDESNGAPTIQRHYITHAVRTLYDANGNVRYTDSGFWLREFDRNAHKTIESLVTPEVPIRQENNNLCKDEVFCGMPFYSCRQLHTGGFWVPAPSPLIREVGSLKLISRENIGTREQRMKFNLTGSYLMSFQIRPRENVELANWNIMESVPEPNVYYNKKAYFVMINHGLVAPPMEIILDFKLKSTETPTTLVDIALVTFHWEYHKEHTPAFANLLARIPKWAFAVPSVASLQAWTF